MVAALFQIAVLPFFWRGAGYGRGLEAVRDMIAPNSAHSNSPMLGRTASMSGEAAAREGCSERRGSRFALEMPAMGADFGEAYEWLTAE